MYPPDSHQGLRPRLFPSLTPSGPLLPRAQLRCRVQVAEPSSGTQSERRVFIDSSRTRPFFALLGERCQQIEAVAMDMSTAFDLEVKRHRPQAEVPYELLHVVARHGRE